MSFETDIIDKYQAVFNDRLWWDRAPDGMTAADRVAPFCIVELVGGKYLQYVDNSEHEFLNAHLQFGVWGARRIEVADAMRQLAYQISVSNTDEFYANALGAPVGDSNEVLALRGSRQDFTFWYKNPLYVPPV